MAQTDMMTGRAQATFPNLPPSSVIGSDRDLHEMNIRRAVQECDRNMGVQATEEPAAGLVESSKLSLDMATDLRDSLYGFLGELMGKKASLPAPTDRGAVESFLQLNGRVPRILSEAKAYLDEVRRVIGL
jgi:hypothetical protein